MAEDSVLGFGCLAGLLLGLAWRGFEVGRWVFGMGEAGQFDDQQWWALSHNGSDR
ncbi:hypothetical protein [Atopomonas sediminilitoris]|uniref:hypothetical protein n=1 Tax=Atopomonas sediminilitoris TaxID=2919919 RepID=UPI001F4DB1A7|nr:hypothetical protein [Atopomonas sediminilitoris]MCJ8168617.1 hypothetical protein [Atopomonas sediminilitoris]